MTDTYYYGDYTKKEQRDIDRNRSRENAETKAYEGKEWDTDKAFMKNLDSETTKRQQEHMLSRAEDVASEYDAGAWVKKQAARKRAARRKR